MLAGPQWSEDIWVPRPQYHLAAQGIQLISTVRTLQSLEVWGLPGSLAQRQESESPATSLQFPLLLLAGNSRLLGSSTHPDRSESAQAIQTALQTLATSVKATCTGSWMWSPHQRQQRENEVHKGRNSGIDDCEVTKERKEEKQCNMRGTQFAIKVIDRDIKSFIKYSFYLRVPA